MFILVFPLTSTVVDCCVDVTMTYDISCHVCGQVFPNFDVIVVCNDLIDCEIVHLGPNLDNKRP